MEEPVLGGSSKGVVNSKVSKSVRKEAINIRKKFVEFVKITCLPAKVGQGKKCHQTYYQTLSK